MYRKDYGGEDGGEWATIETSSSVGLPRVTSRPPESTRCQFNPADRNILSLTMVCVAVWCFVIGYIGGPYLTSLTSSTATVSTTSTVAYTTSSSSSTAQDGSPSIYDQVRSIYTYEQPMISMYNEYTIDRPLSGDYPWDNIAEPYRVTTFTVTNALTDSAYRYEWYIDGWHKEDGSTMDMVFGSPTGTEQTLTVNLVRVSDSSVLATSSLAIMVKYVRREIRTLLDQDREAFFQGVAIMQRVPTQVGKKIYGKNYRSRDFFNRIHLYFGGSKSCDHWHQGPGFVTSHVTFSLMFEQSLQQINPSVTLPYWDFTLESTFYTPNTFRDSGVFSSDWFGDAVCNNSQHTPTEGRFSYVPVMENAQNFSAIINPYGLLRSPWNADPTPYLTRSNTIYNLANNLKPSGCKEYHHALSFTDWKSLATQLNSNAHGHIHELLGGSWNADLSLREPGTTAGLQDAYEFAHATEAYSKILWRYDFLICPEGCASDTPEVDCQCYCTQESYQNLTAAHILANTGIIKSLAFYDKDGLPIENWQNKTSKQPYDALPGYTEDETSALYDEIMSVLCNPGYMGDMFQATSTNDITFWILHPTLERLWHLTRLNAARGLIAFDDTWPDTDISCSGHFSYDHTPFKNIFDSNDTVYTNAQLYELLSPSRDAFPYVYENFRWSHCTYLGYDMTGSGGK